jgi:hypothetical protein
MNKHENNTNTFGLRVEEMGFEIEEKSMVGLSCNVNGTTGAATKHREHTGSPPLRFFRNLHQPIHHGSFLL